MCHPTTGERVGLSFITPRTVQDLERRRTMMAHWARVSCGMMGRTPDFMNVTIMAMAAAGDYFAQNRPEFKDNIQRYYEYIREHDLVLTHTLVNLQRSRSPRAAPLADRTDVALAVVRETDAGIVVRGPRVLATLGPLADEIAVYPARNHELPPDAQGRYSFAFAIPCNTPGLKFLCRESFDLGRSHFDHPLGSRFEEMDAIVFFDDVLVPWERVFLLGDVELANRLPEATNRNRHSGSSGGDQTGGEVRVHAGPRQPHGAHSGFWPAHPRAADDRRNHRKSGDHQSLPARCGSRCPDSISGAS